MKVINHTANNSANYLKKIPLILDDDVLKKIDEIMDYYFVSQDETTVLKYINTIFNSLYRI